jgi:AcrR family transcriptional regulator
MARRGSYSKGIAKREEILDQALKIVARAGYSRATVRELADAVGLSQTGLLHYFGTKEQLFAEVLRRRDELDARAFQAEAEAAEAAAEEAPDIAGAYTRLVAGNAEVPGLVQLYTRFSAEAAEDGHPAHEFFRERYVTLRRATAEAVRGLQEAGRLPPTADAERLAVLLAALMDGLQVQWLYDQDVDMADHIGYFWDLIAPSPQSSLSRSDAGRPAAG